MYCTNCGEENQGTSKFCFNCGKPLKEISSIQLVKSEILKKVEARAIQSRLYAGFLKRVFAFLLDIILLMCLNIVLKIAVSMNLIEPAAATLTSFISLWFYFASMESSEKQATLGKLALRIKVVSTTGDRISFGRATARHFSRIASAFILLIGYLMVAITAKKQALHDKMANCLVVNKAVTADRIKEDGLASPLSKPVLVGLIVFTCCIPVTGIIAAIVVPAYQDYTYRSNRFTHNVKNQQPNPRPGRAPSDGSFADSREANIRPLPPVQLSEAQYEVESDKLLSAHDWPNLEILSLQWTTQFPSNSKAWNTLAIAETNSRKFDEALIAYNQALKLSPNNPVIIDNINRNNIFKDNDGLAVQANEYRKNNEWFALENHSLQWTKKYKDNPWGWNFLGLAYLANGKLKPSLQAFEKALSYLPGDEIILQNIAIAKNFIENQRRGVAIEPSANIKTPSSNRVIKEECSYKAVMTDDDMRACGISPPASR